MHSVPALVRYDSHTESRRLGGSNSRSVFSHSLEAGRPRSRCQGRWFLSSEAVWKDLLQTSSLASEGLLDIFVVSWLLEASSRSLLSSSHSLLPGCLSVFKQGQQSYWIQGPPTPGGPCICASVAQSCATVCNPMDCSLSNSSVQGILQARILEWVAMPSSRRSS